MSILVPDRCARALTAPGQVTTVGGVPEGFAAAVLLRLAETHAAPTLYVARDDARLARLSAMLAFFDPGCVQVTIPAWDCLPYDRVSPRADIASRRLAGLVRLLGDGAARPKVVLTTVNAALQRVPPRTMLADATLPLAAGASLDTETLLGYLERNGFVRAGTVMDAGDYAVRGGIVDIFPPNAERPVRLDFFGDTIESMRWFDPVSQRRAEPADALYLAPVSEVLLNPQSIARFRSAYRRQFGAVTGEDPLYEAVSAGRRYSGIEHWLPLFHDGLETLFDYVADGPVLLDHRAMEARDDRFETIADFYDARANPRASSVADAPYHPVPPEALFLDADEWARLLAGRPVSQCSPFVETEGGADAGARDGRDFVTERAQRDGALFETVSDHIDRLQESNRGVLIASAGAGSRDRMVRLLREHGVHGIEPVADWRGAKALPPGIVAAAVLPLERGFVSASLAVIAEQDILGARASRPERRRRKPAENFLVDAAALADGDLVVHVDHGIGRYDGLVTLEVDHAPHDCLRILYDGDDRLFLPVENIELLSRYGSADQPVALDRLGGAGWQARKARLKQRIREMANQLIGLAAERATRPAPKLAAPGALYDAFCAGFPYVETEDQARAIDEAIGDLDAGRAMDRLVCGDVGFGKTEVALRAAFHAIQAGKQVAVLTPTTLLSRQHMQTFGERFARLPVRIAQLSRLVPAKEQAAVKRGIAGGEIDIVIGTHALLGKQIAFNDLGLVVVDEEQHFGVAHKERLKQLKAEAHVLTLTATPIPRTLQMALSGVRDMSVIATPPVDRLAVRTFILPYDPVVVREALMREHLRGGQTFYVCPRIADLDEVAERVRQLVPEVKVAVAHGRLAARALDSTMSDFYDAKFDVLVSTAIIESGLDLQRVNTMIVHRADRFGLAQLYQLRGRIGRAKLRGYAYLTLPPGHRLTDTAHKRLQVIHRLDGLGAGFSLASHDLDIRGAGNLLGPEQSGHVREVGIELYQHMLEEAVATARAAAGGEAAPEERWSPTISLGTSVLIPEGYVRDLDVRLTLYRRVATLEDQAGIDAFVDELTDRFGPPPESVHHLLEIMAIKQLCRQSGIERVEAGPKGAVLSFREDGFGEPAALVRYVSAPENEVRLRPDNRLIVTRRWPDTEARLEGVQRILRDLCALAGSSAPC